MPSLCVMQSNGPLKNGLCAAQGRAAEFRGSERAKNGFFDGLLKKDYTVITPEAKVQARQPIEKTY